MLEVHLADAGKFLVERRHRLAFDHDRCAQVVEQRGA
jgi:hypothetical protein